MTARATREAMVRARNHARRLDRSVLALIDLKPEGISLAQLWATHTVATRTANRLHELVEAGVSMKVKP